MLIFWNRLFVNDILFLHQEVHTVTSQFVLTRGILGAENEI